MYDIEKMKKREAINAGNRALNSLRTARENLNSAKNWGLADMFVGGFFYHDAETFQEWIRRSRIWSRRNMTSQLQ